MFTMVFGMNYEKPFIVITNPCINAPLSFLHKLLFKTEEEFSPRQDEREQILRNLAVIFIFIFLI